MKYCLVKNGAARYNILIPKNADRDIRFAAEELGKLLKRATLSWFITYDFGDRNVISLGNTELAAKYGLSGDFDELFEHGYRIKTIEGNIFIYAATSIGVINGVYGFLEKTLNYDYFFKDTFYIDRVKEFVIDELDIIDKPDIRERIVSQGFQGSDYEYAELRRFRLIKYRESFPDVFSAGAYHNCFGYLPPSDYFKEHPSWYSDNINTKRANQGQLCYTARGNKKEYELMVEESAKRMFAVFNGNKHDKVVFALNDSWLDWNENCTCSACEKNKEKYGSYVASNILFLKAVGDRVEKMLKNIGDKRAETFLIVFYAYYQLAIPPVNEIFDDKGNKKRDKNGDPCFTFAPELAFGNHLSLVYARGACDLVKGYFDPSNRQYLDEVKEWSALCKNGIFLWTYDRYFDQGGVFIPYNSFNKMQELYKFAFENKVRWIYNENCLYNSTATAFNVLKGYLHAKLGWNTCLKQDKLENKFFSVMYGTQCGTMYEIYKEIVSFCEEQVDKLNFPRRTSSIEIFRSPSYWNRDLLISWLDKMEKAEKELLNNGEIKEAEHVIIEEIFPRATLLRVFRDDFKKSERVKMLYRLRDDCIKYDITSLGAGSIGFIADYLEMFGLTEEEIWG